MVANKIFWALGYYQVENHLIAVQPDRPAHRRQGHVPAAVRDPPADAARRPRRRLRARARNADGSYRAVAGRAVPGRVLGGFRYHGTRPDDPNDVVPHEHRRELRALKVFGAWTNLVDMKAGNTLDTVIEVDGRGVVRHYLQDVGSTFGSSAIGARDYDEGCDYLYQGRPLLKRAFLVGFPLPVWATVPYPTRRCIGRFEGKAFDPLRWKPRAPTAAFLRARADDTFWAARRVAAFSDDMIRAIARTGEFSDPRAADALADGPGSAARQDRPRLPAGGEPDRRRRAVARRRADVRQRRRRRRRRAGAGGVRRRMGALRQRHRRDDADRRARRRHHAARRRAGWPAGRGRGLREGADQRRRRSARLGDAGAAYFRRTAHGWTLVGLERQP